MAIHWLLLVAGLVIALQVALFRRGVLKRLSYERYFDREACFAGDEVQMVERIGNRKLLPVPWLRLEAVLPASLRFYGQHEVGIDSGNMYQNHKSLFSLMPYTEVTRRHQVQCMKRGHYNMNSVAMTSGDLLGLVSESAQLHPDCRITVYPKPIPIEEVPLPSSSWLGETLVKRWIVEDPFMVVGVREYRIGDPLGSVHWKSTAKSGKLHVHQRGFSADRKLMIYLNIDDSATMWNVVTIPALIERGIVYVASVAEQAIRQGIPTGLRCNGRLIDGPLHQPVMTEAHTGSSHMTLIFEALAKLELRRSVPCAELLEYAADRGEANTDCLLITAYVDDRLQLAIDRLRRLGNAVDVMLLSDSASDEGGEPDDGRQEAV